MDSRVFLLSSYYMKPTLLFDLDGTLIDSTYAILDGFHFAYEFHGFSIPNDDDITSLIGFPLDIMLEKLGVTKSLIPNFVEKYKEKYREIYLEKTTLLEGVRDGLELAYGFADLGVVTTKTSKYSKTLLENLGVYDYFGVIIGREDTIKLKPDPEPIQNALKFLNRPTQNAFMVGDTMLDALSAKSAGVISVGVKCGYGSDLEKYFDYLCEDATTAIKLIKSINS